MLTQSEEEAAGAAFERTTEDPSPLKLTMRSYSLFTSTANSGRCGVMSPLSRKLCRVQVASEDGTDRATPIFSAQYVFVHRHGNHHGAHAVYSVHELDFAVVVFRLADFLAVQFGNKHNHNVALVNARRHILNHVAAFHALVVEPKVQAHSLARHGISVSRVRALRLRRPNCG